MKKTLIWQYNLFFFIFFTKYGQELSSNILWYDSKTIFITKFFLNAAFPCRSNIETNLSLNKLSEIPDRAGLVVKFISDKDVEAAVQLMCVDLATEKFPNLALTPSFLLKSSKSFWIRWQLSGMMNANRLLYARGLSGMTVWSPLHVFQLR